jgi:hypothetical protein
MDKGDLKQVSQFPKSVTVSGYLCEELVHVEWEISWKMRIIRV